MKYPYYNPNLRFIDVVRSFSLSEEEAEQRIKDYFRNTTGKKHIILTNSCRSALYLAYKSLDRQGQVVTTPLTCKAAIDPISETDNIPVFADINRHDLNIMTDDIEKRITDKTIAIQAVHTGGVSCDMARILSIAAKYKLWVIEDCAQSLGSTYKEKHTGSFGDIACFSLIKNAYGIGGGVLATSNDSINQIVQNHLLSELNKQPYYLSLFRIIRCLLSTRRRHGFFSALYDTLMVMKNKKYSYESVEAQLRRISSAEKRIAAVQIARFPYLQEKRKNIGKMYCHCLFQENMMFNNNFDLDASSFSKLFIYHPAINSIQLIRLLRAEGIEAMHLEHKHGSPYQQRIVPFQKAREDKLTHYNQVHDSLLSLPLYEDLEKEDIAAIIHRVKKLSREIPQ